MMDILYYLLMMGLLAGLIVGGAWVARGYMTGTMPAMPGMAMFGPKPDKRLDVIEQSNIDGKRRLLLIRRDDVEHLIMTGGPVDVVIETGIGQQPQRRATAEVAEAPVYARPPRRFAQASGE